MKKKLLYCLCCAALFAGCTTEPELIDVVAPQGTPQIKISGTINQTYTTRVDDGGFCDGDQIGLFGVNYSENNTVAGELLDSGNQVDNARYTFDEANWNWVSSGSIYYKDAETNIDLYGYYPYGSPATVREYAFEVAQDQSGNNTIDGYAQSDFLWGKAENVAPSEEKVKIKFNHRMACANVVLTQGEGFAEGEFDALEKSVLVINTTRKAVVDLQSGEVIATGEAESEGIVMKSNEEGFRAIVVPQTVEAGKALFSITVNGITYRYKMSDTAVDYQSGKQTKFTIKINKKSHSGEYEFSLVDCQIVDWIADLDTHGGEARQYYVVHQEEPGTLSAKLRAAKKDPTKIKNLKISGKIDAADFYFMRDSMTVLQAINLKESKIYAFTKASAFKNGLKNTKSWENNNELVTEKWGSHPLYYYPCEANEVPSNSFCFNEFSINGGKQTIAHFVFPEIVNKIGRYAFYGCFLLSGALIIPDGVIEIGEDAFGYCENISTLSLPANLEVIGGGAFMYCTNLTGSLNLPSTLKRIEHGAFAGCSHLTGELILPEGLEHLGASAFSGCSKFTGSLRIPESIKVINSKVFSGCSGLNGQLILHDNLTFGTESQHYGFRGCHFQGELKIPASVKVIPEECFCYCSFTSIAPLPEGLVEIRQGAFAYCSKLSGIVELPKSLIALGANAFCQCGNLEGIILPQELGLLKDKAFGECFSLNKIICKASEPPIITSSTFSGVAKDNFTIEVPEQSINRYQSDIYWGEFKRIGVYHDFSISRRLIRTLNAEYNRDLVLRAPANYAWSIESHPDWCTITPSSGIGKTDITITVKEMTDSDVATFEINTGAYNSPKYETHNGREGEIVFLLNDKNYRTTLKVEQYDADVTDGQVIVNQTATEGNGVNIVFMGDCFDARDIANGSYLKGVNEAIGHYFDIEPYKTYKPYFNIYTVVGMSNDSGMGTVNTIRDAKFGSQYSLDGISPNHETTYEYAMRASTVNEDNLGQTLVVMIENTTEYGGICYMWGDGSAIACCPMSDDAYPYDFRGIVQHEAGGHGFGKLADEYIYHNAFIQTCTCPCCNHLKEFREAKDMGWYRNLESFGDMDKVGWSHLIFNPKYSNIVDVYEGGFFHSRGIFRSEPNSCMNNNIPYYSAISRQEMVERIMKYAGKQFDINEFYANDVLDLQGNITITEATRLTVEEDAITLTGAGKQMPPKYMGDKPQLKKSNK